MDSQRRFKDLVCESISIERQRKTADAMFSASLVALFGGFGVVIVSLVLIFFEWQTADLSDRVMHLLSAAAGGSVIALFAFCFVKAGKTANDCEQKAKELAAKIETLASQFHWNPEESQFGNRTQAAP